jgi:hypothetical protein
MSGARRTSAGSGGPASGRSDRPEVGRPGALWWRGLRLVTWGGVIAATVLGLRQLQAYVRSSQLSRPCELEWVNPPNWLTLPGYEPIQHDLAAATGMWTDVDVHDPNLCRRIGEGLARSPWVAEVQRITKQASGRIRIEAVYREPFALVEVDDKAYLIDRAGTRLPVVYKISQVEDRYWNDWFRITGVAAPVPDEGAAWTGDDLAAGLQLVEFLKGAIVRGEVPFRSSLRAVDVANFKRRADPLDGELRIFTIYPQCYINWGLPPGAEYNIEPPAITKLAMLRTVYADLGQLPENILDVRWPSGVTLGKMRRG